VAWITRLAGIARIPYLEKIAPGLAKLLRYQRVDLSHDIIAGLSVAAVALPVDVAYAELAGFGPAVGLYSSILPLLAYAIFGTSRQLIVGPDAATCALVTAAVTPLAAGDQAPDRKGYRVEREMSLAQKGCCLSHGSSCCKPKELSQ